MINVQKCPFQSKLGFKWKLKHLLDKTAVDKTTVKEMAADELGINY